MRTCPSCGGIIGRDCFNPSECATISAREEAYNQKRAEDGAVSLHILEQKFERLLQIVQANGIDVSELLSPYEEPAKVSSWHVPTDDLPF